MACTQPRVDPRTHDSAATSQAIPQLDWKELEFTILEDYDKGDPLEEVERDFVLFRELGITTWRGSFGWDDYQPAPDSLDLDWLHRFIELAHENGIRLRPYLAYTPEWAAMRRGNEVWNDPPGDLDQWARFAGRLAAELSRHPNVLSYEIYNEENVSLWWDGNAEEFARVVLRGAAAIDSADRDVQVLAGGMVWPDAGWMEAVCEFQENDARLDAVAFHAYPETWTPDSVTVETYLRGYADEFLPAVDEACGEKPIWINELGYATAGARTERQQASWWVRAIATFAAAPRVEQLGVYEIKDLPRAEAVIGDAENYNLGLTKTDRTPKLAFHTVRTIVRLLAGRIAVDTAGVQSPASRNRLRCACSTVRMDDVYWLRGYPPANGLRGSGSHSARLASVQWSTAWMAPLHRFRSSTEGSWI